MDLGNTFNNQDLRHYIFETPQVNMYKQNSSMFMTPKINSQKKSQISEEIIKQPRTPRTNEANSQRKTKL